MIDKTFLLNYNIGRNKEFIFWSDAINKSYLSTINLAMDLPLPTGKQIIFGLNAYLADSLDVIILLDRYAVRSDISLGQSVDITNEIKIYNDLQRLKSILNKERLDIIANNLGVHVSNYDELIALCETQLLINTLKKIGTNNVITSSGDTLLNALNFIEYINKHQMTKVSSKALSNFNVRLLHKVMGSKTMFNYTQDTIDDILSGFKNTLDRVSTKSGVTLDSNNHAYVITMDLINLIGKKDVGPSANGLKTYFGNCLYLNSKIKKLKLSDNIIESDTYALRSYILPTTKDKREKRVIGTLADIKMSLSIKNRLVNAYRYFDPNSASSSDLYFTRLNMSNIFSALLSLAVDNAKELGLGKMNATTALINMHIALISLGYSTEEIVNITISPAFERLVEATTIRLEDGNFVLTRLSASVFQSLIETASSELEKLDLQELMKLCRLGAEITQEALIFGINLGTSSSKDALLSKINNIETGLSQQLKWFNNGGISIISQGPNTSLNTLINKAQEERFIDLLCLFHGVDTELYRAYLRNKLHKVLNQIRSLNAYDILQKVDMHRFFVDSDYLQLVIDVYDLIKLGVNIYAALVNNPHYYAMYKAFDLLIEKICSLNAFNRFYFKLARTLFDPNIVDNKMREEDVESDPETGLNIMPKGKKAYVKETDFKNLTKPVTKIFNQYVTHRTLQQLPTTFMYNGQKINLLSGNGLILLLKMMTNVLSTLIMENNKRPKNERNKFLEFLTINDSVIYLNEHMVFWGLTRAWALLVGDTKNNHTSRFTYELITKDYRSLMSTSLASLEQYGIKISNTNLTFADIFRIYEKILSGFSNTALLDFESLHQSSKLLTNYDKAEINVYKVINTDGKIGIDQGLFMAGIYLDVIRRKPLNRVIYFNKESHIPSINLDYKINLFANSATQEALSVEDTMKVKSMMLKGQIEITFDGTRYHIYVKKENELIEVCNFKQKPHTDATSLTTVLESLMEDATAKQLFVQEIRKPQKLTRKWLMTTNSALTAIANNFNKLGIKCVVLDAKPNRQMSSEESIKYDTAQGFYENGTIYLLSYNIKDGKGLGVALHELMHCFMGYFKAEAYDEYHKFMYEIIKPYISNIKMPNSNQSYLEYVLSENSPYYNMLELDQYEEAFMQLLTDAINGDINEDVDLILNGKHLYEELEYLRSYFINIFGFSDFDSVISLMKTTISDVPLKFADSYWNTTKTKERPFLEAIKKANKTRAIGGYVRELLNKNVLIKVDC